MPDDEFLFGDFIEYEIDDESPFACVLSNYEITCKMCGVKHLYWLQEQNGKWRLYSDKGKHVCFSDMLKGFKHASKTSTKRASGRPPKPANRKVRTVYQS